MSAIVDVDNGGVALLFVKVESLKECGLLTDNTAVKLPVIDLIYCRECKYYAGRTSYCSRNNGVEPVKSTDYCSKGERCAEQPVFGVEKEAESLFGKMRSATAEEERSVSDYITKISRKK